MNLRFLETFVWVARLGSFRATASKLHLTQAAVSGRMTALETDLQTKLFVRQGRQMRLSGAGKTLLHHAESLLKAEQALRLDLSAPAELRGRVRVGVMETIVYTWFGEFLAQLQAHHPMSSWKLPSSRAGGYMVY
nr:LysR family transcriptional regulator [Paenalcaligenes hominis]